MSRLRAGNGWSLTRAVVACTLALLAAGEPLRGQSRTETSFASRVERFSEPGGYFDTDNLISNERSYLHPLDALRERGVNGGVYIGVGPDQNFSYIAQVRPSVAFIVDVRRDNMLLHLLFKALFMMSRDRTEYLSLLFARPPPEADRSSKDGAGKTDLRSLVQHFDAQRPSPAQVESIRAPLHATIAGFGVPLSTADRETINRFHRTFIDSGLSLKFQSAGRAPRSVYPTYRDLLLETDRSGNQANYLASDAAFQVVKKLQAQDQVIPVVGNLAGDRALASIARLMIERGDRLSAFYLSNVELYLWQDGAFPQFMTNLARLPSGPRSVVIRAVFGTTIDESVPGYYSTSVVQPVADLVRNHQQGRYRSYWSLIAR
ncbi:MAG TPA: hypothetical protein VH702_13150 [Vicinamibacterales bacterium]